MKAPVAGLTAFRLPAHDFPLTVAPWLPT